jgi:hypothetical protein
MVLAASNECDPPSSPECPIIFKIIAKPLFMKCCALRPGLDPGLERLYAASQT